MKQRSSLDIAKFIASILIIVLHTSPFSSYSKVLSFGLRNVVTIIAVPFFFATSGFLFSEKLSSFTDKELKVSYFKKYIKRLVIIYLFWSAVYFPFVVIKWTRQGFNLGLVFEYIKDFFFEGSYSTIWFLPALITAVSLILILHKKLSYRKIFLIGCGFYLFTLLGSSYYGLAVRIPVISQVLDAYYGFFDTIKNGLCFGLVFVSLGAMIFEEKIFEKMSIKRSLLGFAGSVVLLCAEVVLYVIIGNNRGVDTVFSLIPVTFFALIIVLNIQLPENDMCVKLRKYSTLMFLCQRIPLSIVELYLSETVIATNSILFFITILITTLLISFLLERLSQRFKVLG